jgi:3-hydroxyisobutyrate dehydrogenase-like beta-hydroxyacid dehydrogenase
MKGAIGFLHPGSMGAAVAAGCSGDRLWASEGRSTETARRAGAAGLADCATVSRMVDSASVIVSICPPDQAFNVAAEVADLGFSGLYVDANAISPATALSIGALHDHFLDGGIVGPPPLEAGTTRLYLSGANDEAQALARRWHGSPLGVHAINGDVGAASALKMCFAAWGKHNYALLLAINAVARSFGVTEALHDEWAISRPDHQERSEFAVKNTSHRAWRWHGEMYEIAATFEAAGLPAEFHLGAAKVYREMARFKDQPTPSLEKVLDVLLDGERQEQAETS